MKYTTHNWTVSSLYTDTIQVAKNLPLPDLDYVHDFKKSSDEPTEASITNITGEAITSMEHIRIGSSPVNNVYAGTGVDFANMPSQKTGVQTMVEVSEIYSAVNSVTGEEILLPCKGRVVLRFPTVACVTETMVQDLLSRTVAAALNTGAVDAKRQVQIARGALLPDGL